MCVYVCVVCMCVLCESHRCQKRVLNPLELEQQVVSHPGWVLGIELESSKHSEPVSHLSNPSSIKS